MEASHDLCRRCFFRISGQDTCAYPALCIPRAHQQLNGVWGSRDNGNTYPFIKAASGEPSVRRLVSNIERRNRENTTV